MRTLAKAPNWSSLGKLTEQERTLAKAPFISLWPAWPPAKNTLFNFLSSGPGKRSCGPDAMLNRWSAGGPDWEASRAGFGLRAGLCRPLIYSIWVDWTFGSRRHSGVFILGFSSLSIEIMSSISLLLLCIAFFTSPDWRHCKENVHFTSNTLSTSRKTLCNLGSAFGVPRHWKKKNWKSVFFAGGHAGHKLINGAFAYVCFC